MIIFDLEFNQAYTKTDALDITNRKCPFEIIQIGAVKLNDQLQFVQTFNAFVKPILYPTLHPFVEKLTGISNSDLAEAESFPSVYKDFLAFMGEEPLVFGVWGLVDIKELIRNCIFHKIEILSQVEYINIQKLASTVCDSPNKSNIGLNTALSILGIAQLEPLHDALSDAIYTARVYQHIHDEPHESHTYDWQSLQHTPGRREQPARKTINVEALFNQIEKMYNTSLNSDMKKIILMAYKMGQTRQFLEEL